jgi:electron transfer flavoprotein alpha subunit
MTVLCLLELDGDAVADASLRALALAGNLAVGRGEDLAAVTFGEPAAGVLEALASCGAGEVYAVGSPVLTRYAPVAWGRSLAGLIPVASPSAVVAAATDRGSEVMAHLGAITGLDVAANCVTAAWAESGSCALTRYRWAGSLLEDAVLEATPALLTVATDAAGAGDADRAGAGDADRAGAGDADRAGAGDADRAGAGDAGRDGDAGRAVDAGGARGPVIREFRPELGEADLRVLAAESAEESSGLSLATARVVVGGGRGVGGPDGFAALEELAGLLGGVVGVSRVVTSQGWRPHRQQVGQTGTKISPELYLACGISGAIQHMAGCLTAKHIVVVNTDPDAPIMSHAEYAVIGDLHEIIPALVAELQRRGRTG